MPDKKGLDLELLKKLIQIMKDDDLSEVCIEQNDIKVKVKQIINQPAISTQGAAILATDAETSHFPETEIVAEELAIITAPMVGTFYRASSSDAEPYVNIGDRIKTGQVICFLITDNHLAGKFHGKLP